MYVYVCPPLNTPCARIVTLVERVAENKIVVAYDNQGLPVFVETYAIENNGTIRLDNTLGPYPMAGPPRIAASENYFAIAKHHGSGDKFVEFYRFENNQSVTLVDKVYRNIPHELIGDPSYIGEKYLVLGAGSLIQQVYLYKIEDNGSLSKTDTIRAPDSSPNDYFGFSHPNR